MDDLLMILGFLFLFIGLPASIITTIIFAIKKKKLKIPALCIPTTVVSSLVCLAIGASLYSETDEYKQSMSEKQAKLEEKNAQLESQINELKKEKTESDTYTEIQTESVEVDSNVLEIETENSNIETEESEIKSTTEISIQSQEIFTFDLLENWDSHIGENVTVSFEVSSALEHSDGIEIYSPYYDGITSNIRATLKNGANVRQGDWITVTGIVGDRPYEGLKDAVINDVGDKPKELFSTAKAEYDEQKRIEAQSYEDAFKENAESPTYDDLMRYPDTYKEKQIKVEVKIVRIEPDGLIFDGDIEGTMSGEKVAIYDGREKKEPKLREGDSVTIYGYGKGLTTVKVQDVSGWIPKTVDEYDIPAIDIRYIEF